MTTANRTAAISAFYTANADRLMRAVRGAAATSDQTIEDACQNAWTVLVRRPDVALDAAGFAWLRRVATHEAWRLCGQQLDENPAGDFHGPANQTPGELGEPIARDPRSAEDRALARIEHRERLAWLAALKPAEREALVLQGLGYSYREIAAETGATYTAVNRRINEARGRLHKIADTDQENAA